ncbi:membrane protein [Streptococcus suis]|uniref:Membrane protein n=2 Tax=Streptococcus TaxID=1301 RepID=A0A116MFE6_STRSU|nr:membrane protein [Streptococcus suis]
MKKVNQIDIKRFVQLIAIIYLVFVLLADIMKW